MMTTDYVPMIDHRLVYSVLCLARHSRGAATVALLSSVLCLAGCAKRETAVQAGIRTQTLLVGNLAEPRDLDPHVIVSGVDDNIVLALFEGLTAPDKDGNGGCLRSATAQAQSLRRFTTRPRRGV